MSNGTDHRYRSRKFIVAGATFIAITVAMLHGEFALAKDAQDTALVIAAAGAVFAGILKLYSDANLKDNE